MAKNRETSEIKINEKHSMETNTSESNTCSHNNLGTNRMKDEYEKQQQTLYRDTDL